MLLPCCTCLQCLHPTSCNGQAATSRALSWTSIARVWPKHVTHPLCWCASSGRPNPNPLKGSAAVPTTRIHSRRDISWQAVHGSWSPTCFINNTGLMDSWFLRCTYIYIYMQINACQKLSRTLRICRALTACHTCRLQMYHGKVSGSNQLELDGVSKSYSNRSCLFQISLGLGYGAKPSNRILEVNIHILRLGT